MGVWYFVKNLVVFDDVKVDETYLEILPKKEKNNDNDNDTREWNFNKFMSTFCCFGITFLAENLRE